MAGPKGEGREIPTSEGIEADTGSKRELTVEEQHKIDNAVAIIDQLVRDGKVPDADIYMEKADDPEVQKMIDKVHEDLDYDPNLLGMAEDKTNELREKRETEEFVTSIAEKIAETHFRHLPRMGHDIGHPERRLEVGIKDRNLDNIVSALRDMKAVSAEEIKKIVAAVVKKDEAELFYSTINSHLDELDREADAAAGMV